MKNEKFCTISPSGNRYYLVRHAECISNVKKISSYSWEKNDALTNEGIKQAKRVAQKLQNYKINLIFCSPFRRTKQTLEIINKKLKINAKNIFEDERLVENNFGVTDKKPYEEFHKLFSSEEDYFTLKVPKGENYLDIMRRTNNFLSEIELKYKKKKILIISHGLPLRILELVAQKNSDLKESAKQLKEIPGFQKEEIRILRFKC